jgi:hypothetical protein
MPVLSPAPDFALPSQSSLLFLPAMSNASDADHKCEDSTSPSSLEDTTLHHGDLLEKERDDIPAAVVLPEVDSPLVDYPDGGFQAWLVIFGVRLLAPCLPLMLTYLTPQAACVTFSS